MKNISTLSEMLSNAATITNKHQLFYLTNKLDVEASMSYADIEINAKCIAANLQSRGIKKNDRVALIYSPGLEFVSAFFGCIYAGAIAVPCYPPANNNLMLKLRTIIENAQPNLILSTSDIVNKLHMAKIINYARNIKLVSHLIDNIIQSKISLPIELDKMPWIQTDKLNIKAAADYQSIECNGNDIAFLQYTSGSTSEPKGVIVTHENLLVNLAAMIRHVKIDASDKIISWLPPYHDMGLIGGILTPIINSIPLYMMPPVDFLRSPYSWLQAISKFGGTISAAPNFAYALCNKKISDEQLASLNLTTWRAAVNGAEPINPETVKQFIDKFSACGFNKDAMYPCYGMAESTLFICGRFGLNETHISKDALLNHRIISTTTKSDRHVLISCGRRPKQVLIIDPTNNNPIENEVGEICISGKDVSQGYWNNDSNNENFFTLEQAGQTCRYFKTGDLGFIYQDELYITGRKKDLIIIHGTNHYPQDIEETLYQLSPDIHHGATAAFPIQIGGEERLAIIVGVEKSVDSNQAYNLISQIKHAIGAAHTIAPYSVTIVPYKEIHKTTSGKIQRQKNKSSLINNELTIIAQDNKIITGPDMTSCQVALNEPTTGSSLNQIMRDELASILNVSQEIIDDNKFFTDYGLDSLMVIELENKLETHLKGAYQFNQNDVYDYPNIAALSEHIETSIKSRKANAST